MGQAGERRKGRHMLRIPACLQPWGYQAISIGPLGGKEEECGGDRILRGPGHWTGSARLLFVEIRLNLERGCLLVQRGERERNSLSSTVYYSSAPAGRRCRQREVESRKGYDEGTNCSRQRCCAGRSDALSYLLGGSYKGVREKNPKGGVWANNLMPQFAVFVSNPSMKNELQ